ncbi:uncharacterized protein METZ01_LOCUS324627, partial [marine metagenome]
KISKIAGGSQEFELPGADGTANQHLKTDGAGNLGWASGTAVTGSTNTWIPTITGANALTGTANFTYDGNTLDVKNGGTASSINLYCETSNQHYIKLKSGPHASATSYTLTLPNAPPTVSGQALTATTAGVGSWAAPSGLSESCNFRARITSDQSNVTGNGASYNMTGAIWTEDWDIGSDFSNGTFTAPANGYYHLGFTAYVNQTDGVTDMTFNMVTPAGTHIMSRGNWSYGTGGTGYASPSSARSGITQSGLFYIASAGTAYINLQGYNAGSDTVDVTAFHTFFWGMRVM